MPISWDEKARRFRGEQGRFIRRDVITSELEKARTEVKDRVRQLSEKLIAREINLPQWQVEMRDQIKAIHLLSAGIARGGKAQLSPSELGKIGALTKEQYQYLNRFALQISSGQQPLNGQILRRAAMYVDASRKTFIETEKHMQANSGVELARRVLNAKESCAGCIEEAAKDFQPIDEVAEIGSQECLTNCLCDLEYKEAA